MVRPPFGVAVAALLVLPACTGWGPSAPTEPPDASSVTMTTLEAPEPDAVAEVTTPAGVTAPGVVALDAAPVEVEVGEAVWVLGLPTADGPPAWVVVAPDGRSRLVTVEDGAATTRPWPGWDPVRPPVAHVVDGSWRWVDTDGAGEVAPVTRTPDGWWAAVDATGGLRLVEEGADPVVVPGPFLPDARPVPLPDGRLAVLADPTGAYGHGVLGDALEAGSVAIVDPAAGEVVERRRAEGRVIEGTAPLLGDLDGDGDGELVVTTSADADGARVEAWPLDDDPRLVGPAVGRSGRWRHQVAVVPAAHDGGPPAVVEVVTPHLDRIVQWLVARDGELAVDRDLRLPGLASHVLGSRNLQQAAAVDVDGDGVREPVGPDGDGDGLLVADRGPDSIAPFRASLGAPVTSNVALAGEGSALAMAVATADGILHVWG